MNLASMLTCYIQTALCLLVGKCPRIPKYFQALPCTGVKYCATSLSYSNQFAKHCLSPTEMRMTE
jgi:hypothetical protein